MQKKEFKKLSVQSFTINQLSSFCTSKEKSVKLILYLYDSKYARLIPLIQECVIYTNNKAI
jgi:hypothetical protein